MESLPLKSDRERLAVRNLEEKVQMVFSDLLWEVVYRQVHLLTRGKGSFAWLDSENLLL